MTLVLIGLAPLATLFIARSLVLGGRLAANEPHLQIVGHYAPRAQPGKSLALGSSENADLLLTEPNIDALQGWLVGELDGTWRYVHHSRSLNAERTRSPKIATAQQFIAEGDGVIVQPAGVKELACSPPFKSKLETRAVTSVLVRMNGQEAGLLLVPADEFVPLPPPQNGFLASCGGRVVITPVNSCKGRNRSIESLPANLLATFGLPSIAVGDLEFGVPLFSKRELSETRIDSPDFAPVYPSSSASLDAASRTYSIDAQSTAIPLSIDGQWFRIEGKRKLLIRRTAEDASQSVWVCRKDSTSPPVRIGEIPGIANGDSWVLGSTQYRLEISSLSNAPPAIMLTPMERSDRQHFFLSLSAGRLNTYGKRTTVPHCSQGNLRLVGHAADVATPLPMDVSRDMAVFGLRMPAWAANTHPQANAGQVELGTACVDDTELRIAPHSKAPPSDVLSVLAPGDAIGKPIEAPLRPGARFHLAGYVLEYRLGSPRYEQVAPLLAFALFLGIVSAGIVAIVDRGLGGAFDQESPAAFGVDDFTMLIAVLTALMTSLMVCGALQLMRMAADDQLIGKPDYVNRQLFWSAMASIVYAAILAGAVADRDLDSKATLATRVLKRLRNAAAVIVAGGLLLLLWVALDAIGWMMAASGWIRGNGLTKPAVLAEWARTFPWRHLAPCLACLVFLILINVFEERLVRAGERFGHAWRLTIRRDIIAAVAGMLLLLPPVAIGIQSKPAWLTFVAWIAGGILALPVLGVPLRQAAVSRRRWLLLVLVLLIAPMRIPRDSLDVAEGLLFVLVGAMAAAGLALILTVAWRFVPERIQTLTTTLFSGHKPYAPTGTWFVEHHVQLLTIGFLALAMGLVLQSGRFFFGVKPAEFATWFLAAGLSMFLVTRLDRVQTRPAPTTLDRTQFALRLVPLALVPAICIVLFFIPSLRLISFAVLTVGLPFAIFALPQDGWRWTAIDTSLRRLRIPITTIFLLLLIELAVLVLYAAEGDFGPLMVLVPSLLFTVTYWVLTPNRNAAIGRRLFIERFITLTVLVLASAGLVVAGYVIVTNESVQNLPFVGNSIHRAADRLVTFTDSWYTSSGSWSKSAKWIAAGYMDDRFISNLHSDLALTAFRGGFGVFRTTMMVLAFVAIAALLGFLAATFHHSHSSVLQDEKDAEAIQIRKSMLVTSLMLWFTTFYLLAEVLIHVLTNYNLLIPQTGLALPWVSSGGSAAVAFSGLIALSLAMAARVYIQLANREQPA
ncbi:MAG TPA: hypothetical protein VF432_15765 [Thermoanaerobaculia bacterium]